MIILVLLSALLFAEEPSFKSVRSPKKYATGLLKSDRAEMGPVDKSFLVSEGKLPGKFHLKDKVELSPIFDQANCGSCVYNSVVKNLEDSYRLRSVVHPRLSRQFLMDCAAEWSCQGSFFSKVAEGLLVQKGTALESKYPYKARDQKCQGKDGLIAPIESWKIIDNSAKSIMQAIHDGYPVSVTVGANNAFMGYSSGVFNACSNVGTNHEVLIYGWDCESSVDADGNCVFDSNGKLPKGVGYWHMPNSWGEEWGESGNMRIKITSQSGRLCNNIAEEAAILETGIPIPVPPEPPLPPNPPVPPEPEDNSSFPIWAWVASGFGLLVLVSVIIKLAIKKGE